MLERNIELFSNDEAWKVSALSTPNLYRRRLNLPFRIMASASHVEQDVGDIPLGSSTKSQILASFNVSRGGSRVRLRAAAPPMRNFAPLLEDIFPPT